MIWRNSDEFCLTLQMNGVVGKLSHESQQNLHVQNYLFTEYWKGYNSKCWISEMNENVF